MDRRFVKDRVKGKEVGDRWKYDCESGDEVEPDPLDPYSTEGFFYREFLRKTDQRRRSPEVRRDEEVTAGGVSAAGARRG